MSRIALPQAVTGPIRPRWRRGWWYVTSVAIVVLLCAWLWPRGIDRGPDVILGPGTPAYFADKLRKLQFVPITDQEGRYCSIQSLQLNRSADCELLVFDSWTGDLIRIASDATVASPGSRVVLLPYGWHEGRLSLESWQWMEPSQTASMFRHVAHLPAPASFVQSETWWLAPAAREAERIGAPVRDICNWMISPDGRYRVGNPGALLKVIDADGQVRASRVVSSTTPMVTPVFRLAWLADSTGILAADRWGLRVFERDTLDERWATSIEDLEAEVFGPLGSAGSPTTSALKAPIGLYGPLTRFYDAGNSLFQFQLLRGASDAFPEGGDEIWSLSLSARTWKKLGPADQIWTAFDLAERVRVQFKQDAGKTIVLLASVPDGEERELARGNWPLPESELGSTIVLPKPDRLFWISKDRRLWMLPLDGGTPHCVWPGEEGAKSAPAPPTDSP